MPETRQRHDREFRAGAVRIATDTANPVTQMVRAPRRRRRPLQTKPHSVRAQPHHPHRVLAADAIY